MAIVGRLTLLPVTLSGSAMGFSSKTSSAPDLVDEKHTKRPLSNLAVKIL